MQQVVLRRNCVSPICPSVFYPSFSTSRFFREHPVKEWPKQKSSVLSAYTLQFCNMNTPFRISHGFFNPVNSSNQWFPFAFLFDLYTLFRDIILYCHYTVSVHYSSQIPLLRSRHILFPNYQHVLLRNLISVFTSWTIENPYL